MDNKQPVYRHRRIRTRPDGSKGPATKLKSERVQLQLRVPGLQRQVRRDAAGRFAPAQVVAMGGVRVRLEVSVGVGEPAEANATVAGSSVSSAAPVGEVDHAAS